MPQLIEPPHPSPAVPQVWPAGHVVLGVQLQTFAVQVCGAVHVPQLSVPPQPFDALPQVKPRAAQVVGVQLPPQTFGVPPPPQMLPFTHFARPQSTTLPQPSGTLPHSRAPQFAASFGTHALPASSTSVPPPHTPATLPPPQTWGATQAAPQFSGTPAFRMTPPQPSDCGPQTEDG